MRLTFRLIAPVAVLAVGGGLGGAQAAQARSPNWSIDRRAPAGIGAEGVGGRTAPRAAARSSPDLDRRGDDSRGARPDWGIDRRALASSGAEGTDGRTAPREADGFYAFLNRRRGSSSPPASRVYPYPARPVYYYSAPPVYYYPARPVYYYPAQGIYYYQSY